MSQDQERRDASRLLDGVWRWTARTTLVVGLVFLALLYGTSTGLRSFLILIAILWCVARLLPDLRPARGLVGLCANGIAWAFATVGWIGMVGPAGALLVAIVMVTSPLARFIVTRKMLPWAAGTSPSTAADIFGRAIADALPVPPQPHTHRPDSQASGGSHDWWQDLPRGAAVQELDDEELCLAWRRSFVRLTASDSVGLRLAVVEARGDYLDELARRHGAQFDKWLMSGARAAGDPSAYIRGAHRHRQRDGHAWPDLD